MCVRVCVWESAWEWVCARACLCVCVRMSCPLNTKQKKTITIKRSCASVHVCVCVCVRVLVCMCALFVFVTGNDASQRTSDAGVPCSRVSVDNFTPCQMHAPRHLFVNLCCCCYYWNSSLALFPAFYLSVSPSVSSLADVIDEKGSVAASCCLRSAFG